MRTIVRFLILTTLLSGIAACNDEPTSRPDSPAELGSFGVGYLSFTAVDSSRDDRSLVVDVWYPVDAQQAEDAERATYLLSGIFGLESEVAVSDLPVVEDEKLTLLVFSHGYGGINRQSVELMEALASHGFIVASPEHTGNSQALMSDSFDEAASRRVPDISFVIDTLFERSEDSEDLFYNRINHQEVGALGHSFGGMTAIGMASGWAGAEADSRVAAIAPISAVVKADIQEESRSGSNAGFTADQLASIGVPVMLIGGTKDTAVPIENNAIAFEEMVNASSVYKVDISGATHTHFTNVCAIGEFLIGIGFDKEDWPNIGAEDLVNPYEETCSEEAFPIDEANRLQNLYVVSFFKRHLLDETGYQEYLTSDYARGEPAVEFTAK